MVRLRDGSRVRLRPISGDDKPLLAGALDRMSEGSRYRRFFHSLDTLSPAMLAYLTEVDHIDHEAIIAIEPSAGDALGVARYVRAREEPEAAEVAFAVVDDWQGRGLGRALLTDLTRRARQEGVRRFVALVQYDNQEAVKLLGGLSRIERRGVGPEGELVIELPEARGIGVQLADVLRAAAAGALTGSHAAVGQAPAAPSTVRARSWGSIRTVVVGSDGSQSADVAVQAAADLAGKFSATLHVVSAYPAPRYRPDALRVLAAVKVDARESGVDPQCHARQGTPATVLADVAVEHDADVIVVGNKGMSGAARLLGSVPNTVSHGAPCSVLIVQTS
jgi:nucleotide-binding universal stress UspA family protein/GNAT superfamily N-acetyltransferase